MTDVLVQVQNVAKFTGSRDRDVAASAMTEVLQQLFHATQVQIWNVFHVKDVPHGVVVASRSALPTGTHAADPASPLPASRLLNDHSELAMCLERLESVRGHDAYTGEHRLVVPIKTDLQQTVLIALARPSAWPDDSVRTTEAFAKIYCNFLNLLDYGERDTLTGLLNRKSFEDTFFKETQRFSQFPGLRAVPDNRVQGPRGLWIGLVDIDFFKKVNDNFGHLIGDEVLLLVANIIRTSFRPEDRVYRFGGEEFVVLLMAQEESQAEAAFERLRHAVESFTFPQVGRVTVSIGFSVVCEGDTPSEAFDRADQAVYRAKKQGRNQVCMQEKMASDTKPAHDPLKNSVELF